MTASAAEGRLYDPRSQLFESRANEIRNFWSYIFWWSDAEHWAVDYRLQRNGLPLWSSGRGMQDYCVGTIEKFPGRVLEVCGRGVEDGQVQVWTQKLQHAVRFDDYVAGAF